MTTGQGYDPWAPPPATASGPRGSRTAIIIVIAVVLFFGVVAALAVLVAGRASSTKASAKSPWTTTSIAGAHPIAGAPAGAHAPASALALANIGVQPGDLGVDWSDDGIQPYSADLANPPPDCAPYAEAFTTRDAGAVHQYSFEANGEYENGGLSSTVIENPSPTVVAAVLPAVRKAAFAPCAEATAEAWLTNHDGQVTVLQLHAAPIDLVTGPNVAGWRGDGRLPKSGRQRHVRDGHLLPLVPSLPREGSRRALPVPATARGELGARPRRDPGRGCRQRAAHRRRYDHRARRRSPAARAGGQRRALRSLPTPHARA